ncbi:hypothetical protein [Mesorhizobium sp. J8]|uniref:hypothetical protein n=1 Tax=Mesorhizobium sp. J8 TaxID=2777475 RepID=UPI001915EE23|nr:hypothetical protein [Mesorhizobium sp. J8]BCM16734.1 hypothetical protein MJ8_04950 [Mesorhizobium sp. J8]
MSKRLSIPKRIRELEPPSGFENPFAMGIRGPHLFATETLCGDWSGDLLLLAQDFAPASAVKAVLEDYGPEAAWRHNDGDGRYNIGLQTNSNLCGLLTMIGRAVELKGEASKECGVLYGNACFFLKDRNRKLGKGVSASKPVFEFVLSKMPRLKVIGCLGDCAFEGVMGWLGLHNSWRTQIDMRKPVRHNHLQIFALAHPGQLGINNRLLSATNSERVAAITADWRAIGRALRAR